MADVYCDQALGTGNDDGTTWANAYQVLATCADNAVAGDDVWVKGDASVGTTNIIFQQSDPNNPTRVHGCKSATSAEPPAQSDLIPGLRTGESRTEANRAYNDADIPTLTVTGAGTDLSVRGYCVIYAMKFVVADNITIGGESTVFEECAFDCGNGELGQYLTATGVDNVVWFVNCEIEWSTANADFIANDTIRIFFYGTVFTHVSAWNFHVASATIYLEGCDLSSAASTTVDLSQLESAGTFILKNSQLHASAVFVTGSREIAYRVENHHSANVTAKSSGTIQILEIQTNNGTIVNESTAVRTGGGDDGNGGWSLAFTPSVGNTQDNYWGLVGPWMAFKITGDGTAQTVSVSIANSGAADYNDDDVYLEIMYPSEGGTAQYDNQTTQMDLLGTPTAITDDTGSTWGTGGNNHQTLSASISPDYVGRAYCRVTFAKNFSSSPETLYVDPLPVVS